MLLLRRMEDEHQARFYIARCKYCGEHFIKSHNRQAYCSDSCKRRAHEEQKKESYLKTKMVKKCPYCGGIFEPTRVNKVYCSEKCKRYARKEQKAEYQYKRRRLIWNHELVSDEVKDLGTGCLREHMKDDFDDEYHAVRKERRRIGC